MSISKIFHCVLLLTFLGLSAFSCITQRAQLLTQTTERMEQYQHEMEQLPPLPHQGQQLYQQLSQIAELQFFQYTHIEDSQWNFTQGTLIDPTYSLLTTFIPIEHLIDTNSETGRLLLKVSVADLLQQTQSQLMQQLIVLWSAYLLLALCYILLIRRLIRSSRRLTHHINGFADNNYNSVEFSQLCSETREIGYALEKCKLHLKSQIEQNIKEREDLNQLVHKDSITGFATRASFLQKMDRLNSSTNSEIGLLMIVQASELQFINKNRGRTEGDQYLLKISEYIRKTTHQFPKTEYYRISTSDFAILIPALTLKDGEKIVQPLKNEFDEYQRMLHTESVAYIGLIPFNESSQLVELLSLADTAVSIAQTLGPNSYHLLNNMQGDEFYGDLRWKQVISELIENENFTLQSQSISGYRNNFFGYYEIFAKFTNEEGQPLSTNMVLGMAERHNLIAKLDKLIVSTVIRWLAEHSNNQKIFGINLSILSIKDESFLAWLTSVLSKNKKISEKIIFELSESSLRNDIDTGFKFVQIAHTSGAKVSIEHFGTGFSSFKFFKEIRPDFIKLDPSYTRIVEQDSNNVFFIKMIINIARKLNIKVIATGVERQEEKLLLESLLIDGMQGYYIEKPKQALSK